MPDTNEVLDQVHEGVHSGKQPTYCAANSS